MDFIEIECVERVEAEGELRWVLVGREEEEDGGTDAMKQSTQLFSNLTRICCGYRFDCDEEFYGGGWDEDGWMEE